MKLISNGQKWTKQGLIFKADKSLYWNQSHAQVPIVDVLDEETLRVYYTSRDKKNRSFTSYIEVDSNAPQRIIYEHKEPILPLGKLGTFDDSGVMASSIVSYNNLKYLYYIGWNIRDSIPYHNCVGLAISEDNGKTFSRYSDGPLWDRDFLEPYFSGTSCVLIDNGVWKMWYLSCTGWFHVNDKPEPRYHLKYAESSDGILWKRTGQVAIDYLDDSEGGIVKASVLKENNIYKMWYSYRGLVNYREDKDNSYRIGYAESKDGITWFRKDNLVSLPLSDKDWDSEMIAYPDVINTRKKKIMFYNGNGFGQTGFGYAMLNNE